MGLDQYHGDEAARFAAVLRGVDYSFRVMMESPLVKRWYSLMAASEAHAAETTLMSAIARLRTSALLIGSVDLVITLAVPVGVWLGFWAILAASIEKARAIVRSENFISGFSQGFVMGILKWEWHHATSRFGRYSPDFFPADNEMGYISANAYNNGLRTGFTHAGLLNEVQRKGILGRIKSLSPSTKQHQWDRLDQINYVIELAAAARRNNIFRTT